jgi:hypothetical protein
MEVNFKLNELLEEWKEGTWNLQKKI